jgi:hypothetical protein
MWPVKFHSSHRKATLYIIKNTAGKYAKWYLLENIVEFNDKVSAARACTNLNKIKLIFNFTTHCKNGIALAVT